MEVQTLKAFTPTTAMVGAAQAVFMSMAYLDTIRPVVLAYKTKILADGQWHIRPAFAARLGDEVILDPNTAYLMSDSDFEDYDAKCKLARDLARLPVDRDDQCPLLVAENLRMQAERELIDAMSSTTNITSHQLWCLGVEAYKKYLDLTLRLLAPFVKTTKDQHDGH